MRPRFAGGGYAASVASLTLDNLLLQRDTNGSHFSVNTFGMVSIRPIGRICLIGLIMQDAFASEEKDEAAGSEQVRLGGGIPLG